MDQPASVMGPPVYAVMANRRSTGLPSAGAAPSTEASSQPSTEAHRLRMRLVATAVLLARGLERLGLLGLEPEFLP